MTISPFSLILLLGAIQGFILATLLWINQRGRQLSNRLLVALIGLMGLMSFSVGIPIPNRLVGLFIELVPLIMAMPLGPLIFFYTQSVLDSSFHLTKKKRRHFYPIVLDWGANLIGWVFVIGMLLGFFPQKQGPAWGHLMDEYNTYIDIPRWLSCTLYLFLTRQFLNHRVAHISTSDEQQQRNVKWLRQFVHAFLIFQCIWLAHLVPYIIPAFREPLLDRFGWYPIYIPLAVLIYWLGLRGYLHTRTTTSSQQTIKSTSPELSEDTIQQVTDSLVQAMAIKQLFLDPELTVDKLGQHTRLAPKLISAVLNQHLRKNFNGFINEYRVGEVKRRLTNPAYEHLTLTGIAFDCGFNSQATFQRTFKQLTGVSPGEYVAQQKKASQIGI